MRVLLYYRLKAVSKTHALCAQVVEEPSVSSAGQRAQEDLRSRLGTEVCTERSEDSADGTADKDFGEGECHASSGHQEHAGL